MKRRSFIGAAAAAGMPGALALSCGKGSPELLRRRQNITGTVETNLLPETIAGMTLKKLHDDYYSLLFSRYLPFWEKGGVDAVNGGFMCLLNGDGTVADDEKYSAFQGHGLWVYSFLYNNFGKNKHFLDIATKARDFIVKNMKAENGAWHDLVYRDGRLKAGSPAGKTVPPGSILGWLAIAAGLAEFNRATGNDEDYRLGLETIWTSLRIYDSQLYKGVTNNGGYTDDMDFTGFRAQGHSTTILWLLTTILDFKRNIKLIDLVNEHTKYILKQFLHPYLLVSNEYLLHDYNRIPGFEDAMETGTSLETQWIMIREATRQGDRAMFDTSKDLFRRYVTLAWDPIFEGFGDGHYYVFDGPERTRTKLYGIKSMRLHTDVLAATLHILEYTGDPWALEWFEKTRAWAIKHFDTPTGVWRQAVDRYGNDAQLPGEAPNLRDNFHQARSMMYILLALERMMKNEGKLSTFH
jgi:N-acylglucosamine 2-epimerase